MHDGTFPPEKIRNVVLDLGGVLYAIDPERTVTALTALAGSKASPMSMDHPLFLDFEMGLVSPNAFRDRLRAAIDSQADDRELDDAWNALLLGPIPGRERWVADLAGRYRVILLSNTNLIHREIWGPECAAMFAHMEQTWFSFDLGMRKPNRDIFDFVVGEMGLNADECLFLDDSPVNVSGAIAAGWHSGLVLPQNDAHFEEYCLKLLGKL